jgi:transposase
MKNKRYSFFIGVDISKSTLDIVVVNNHTLLKHSTIENQPFEIKLFITDLRSIKGLTKNNVVFGMENTGIYTNHLKESLIKLKYDYVIEHPYHLKQSLGLIRGKNDKVDAERIATYLYKHRDNLRLHEGRRHIIDQLSSLVTLRDRLIVLQGVIATPLKEDGGYINKAISKTNNKLCARSLEAVKLDINEIEETIRKTWKSDERTKRLMEIITSIPSIGEVTALQIVITTNEFKDISDPKKFACYAGVAPFPKKSGTALNIGGRVSPHANRKMKSLLHICAVVAGMHVPDIKEYLLRKTKIEGKHKMVVYNAIRFKLIARVFACVKDNRLYSKEYLWYESTQTPEEAK